MSKLIWENIWRRQAQMGLVALMLLIAMDTPKKES